MTDHDKLRLIDHMIADYYEFGTFNKELQTAEGLIGAISSVINFDTEEAN